MYAQALAGRKMVDEAIAMAELNAGHFPQSYYTYFVLAELYKLSGGADQAIENYNRAIELNPRAKGFLEAKIAELQGEIE